MATKLYVELLNLEFFADGNEVLLAAGREDRRHG
jgi:hypothetical protein